MKDYKSLYARFLTARPGELHFAAHSHHFWPDVTREAQLKVWDDAARYNDRKWEYIFKTIVPQVQSHIARILNLKRPDMIALAPNTHDLLVRLFSELLTRPQLKLLTTDSEFHSFARQLRRWEEVHTHLKVTRVEGLELLTNRESFLQKFEASLAGQDVVFVSQVFFNSGLALKIEDIERWVAKASPETVFIIDGYHGFAALPTDLARLEGRVFYLGGGYKYVQAGEGVGFMVVPQGPWRPVITGWFAEYAHLSSPVGGGVGYSQDGMAFWGATMDPSGWYRFLAAWDLFAGLGISIADIHRHVLSLQNEFLQSSPLKGLKPLYTQPLHHHGHFLTFEASDVNQATQVREELLKKQIYIDQRGARLRFGFGMYQDRTDVQALLKRLS